MSFQSRLRFQLWFRRQLGGSNSRLSRIYIISALDSEWNTFETPPGFHLVAVIRTVLRGRSDSPRGKLTLVLHSIRSVLCLCSSQLLEPRLQRTYRRRTRLDHIFRLHVRGSTRLPSLLPKSTA